MSAPEHEGVTRARITLLVNRLTGQRLRDVLELLTSLADLSEEDLRAVAVIVRRICAGAVEGTRQRAVQNGGQGECWTALEYLDGRIASVLECVRHGGVRGLPLPPEAR